jgi:hypothetical protein
VSEAAILPPALSEANQSLWTDVIAYFRCLASVFRPVTIVTTSSRYCTSTQIRAADHAGSSVLAGLLCLTYCIFDASLDPQEAA